MTKYLLTCDCGEPHQVEPGQAGERVLCKCGATLEVPPLRKMRHLPSAAHAPEMATPAMSTWNVRKGLVAALVLVAVVLALMAGWSWYTQPRVAQFDPEAYRVSVERGLENMTPEQSWRWWVEVYRPLAESGLTEFQDANSSHIEAMAGRHRFLQTTLLATAAVFTALAGAVAFWPTSKSGRRGERERGRHR